MMQAMDALHFVSALGKVSMEAGVLVLVVLATQWLFRKQLTPRWRCTLWLLVVLRLLLPSSPGSALSVFNWMPHWRTSESSIDRGEQKNAPAKAALMASPRMPAAPRQPAADRVPTTPRQTTSLSPKNQSATTPRVTPAPFPATTKASALKTTSFKWSWARILLGLWGVGVVMLALLMILTSLRLARKFSGLPAIQNADVLDLLDECQEQIGVRGKLRVTESDAIVSPALHGLFRPCLLLPQGFTTNFSARELRYVFLHELAHLKRRDLWLNWLFAVLQALHWFNPLVWLAFSRWRADRELACDAMALEAVGEEQSRDYGRTILRLLEHFTHQTAAPGMVGILEDKRQLKRRMEMIARFKPSSRWSLLALLLVGLLAVIGLTDAQTKSPSEPAVKAVTGSALSAASTNTPVSDLTSAIRKIKVTVLDAETGHPIAGVRVNAPYLRWHRLNPAQEPPRLTDDEGVTTICVPKHFTKEVDAHMQNFSLNVSATDYSGRSVMWVSDSGNVLKTLPSSYTFRLKKGITIGGFVRDEHGQPVVGARVIPWGSGYRGFSPGSGQQFHQEYSDAPEYGAKGVLTDAHGFWKMDHFPAGLQAVRVDVIRAGGDCSQFVAATGGDRPAMEPATPVSLHDLLATNLVVKLKNGYTIHGMVVDEKGKPISDVRMKARGGQVNQTPIYTLTNHADGTFDLDHWTVPQFVVTLEADGFATKTIVLSAADSHAVKRVVLPPAVPLRVRVLGGHNEPVVGAGFRVIDWRSGNQLVDWKGRTDAAGVAVWTNAPDQPVSLWVQSTNYPVKAVTLLADGTEKVIRLRKGSDKSIVIHLSVTDTNSGAAIPKFEVRRTMQWGNRFNQWGNPGTNGEFKANIASSEFRKGIVSSYKLQVVAAGYQSWTSDGLYFDEGDQNIAVALTKGASTKGIVLQPGGRPAAHAKVMLCTTEGDSVFMNAPNRIYPGRGTITEHSAKDGSFQLAGAQGDHYIVVWHPSGFAVTTVSKLRKHNKVHLQPWASVEGVLRENGKPLANQSVAIKEPLSWIALDGFNLVYNTRTDSRGHFLFTNLPPGSCVIYRMPHIIYGQTTTESHRWPLDLKPGEHKQIDYTFNGREVAGHVETDFPVDWQNDAQVLVLKTSPPPPAPTYWSYVNHKDYQKARQAYAHSPEVLAAERRKQQFQLVFDNNGNFHADDVPPGKYELRLHLTKPPKNNRERFSGHRKELGSLTKEIHVPAGKGTYDLGNLTMSLKLPPDQLARMSKPAELAAKDFDGKPVSLSQFKGKLLLIVFWASWSDRSTEELANLAKLQSEIGRRDKWNILAVNVDGNRKAVSPIMKALRHHWAQAWLEGTNLAKASTAFDISSVPSICLLDTKGRILAHNLDSKMVRVTLQRALKQK